MPQISQFQQNSVRGFLHHPSQPANAALALTHGAGSNCETALLIAIASAFCQAGILVLRFDLPFRQRRPKGPPMPVHAAEDRSGLLEAAMLVREMVNGPIFLGGHSYGGRQASIAAAAEPRIADALLLLSYPLHPPAKPDQPRTGHWPNLQTPAFFLHGTKDLFGTIQELKPALALIPVRTELAIIEGAGHDLKRGRFDIERSLLQPFRFFAARI